MALLPKQQQVARPNGTTILDMRRALVYGRADDRRNHGTSALSRGSKTLQ